MKVIIRVQHGNTNLARSGKVSASSTMSPAAAAQRVAMKCAGLVKDAVHDFPDFDKTGIVLVCHESGYHKSVYEAHLGEPPQQAA